MSFLQSIQDTAFATSIRESTLLYPILLSTHLTALGLFGATVALTDLRILGFAMKNRPMADVHNQFRPFKHFGLTIVVLCGALLATSKINLYWPNPYFKMKMSLLLCVLIHALVFRKSVYKNLAEFDRTGVVPGNAKAAAIISMLLWIGLVTCGRWIGYWEAPTLE
ncbi:MAG: DUF6644 family protein [Acidobacteriota bacterium]